MATESNKWAKGKVKERYKGQWQRLWEQGSEPEQQKGSICEEEIELEAVQRHLPIVRQDGS
jgi:hypothetical protein